MIETPITPDHVSQPRFENMLDNVEVHREDNHTDKGSKIIAITTKINHTPSKRHDLTVAEEVDRIQQAFDDEQVQNTEAAFNNQNIKDMFHDRSHARELNDLDGDDNSGLDFNSVNKDAIGGNAAGESELKPMD